MVLLLGVVTGCDTAAPPSDGALATHSAGIYYGTSSPQNVPLSDGQMLAIGWLHYRGDTRATFCTGTLIGPRHVATAAHCFEDGTPARNVAFGIGLYPRQAVASFNVAEVHMHPQVDAAILVLAVDAVAARPEVTPIAINRVAPTDYRGRNLDAAGYGQTHDNSNGRYFASVLVRRVANPYITVDGQGVQGICFGDSGGPLIGPGPVVLAVESAGSETCVDQDQMTRLDLITSFIDDIVGTPTTPTGCGDLNYHGRCAGDVAEWCDGDVIKRRDCAAEGLVCGWVDADTGYYCKQGTADPCAAMPAAGRCNGTVAEWCDDGALKQRDCAQDGLVCGYVSAELGYYCQAGAAPDPCADIPTAGRCDGDTLVRCANGAPERFDCRSDGRACAFDVARGAYGCVVVEPNPECQPEETGCAGSVAVSCVGGERIVIDCADRDLICVEGPTGAPVCQRPDRGGGADVTAPPGGGSGDVVDEGEDDPWGPFGGGCATGERGQPLAGLALLLVLAALWRMTRRRVEPT